MSTQIPSPTLENLFHSVGEQLQLSLQSGSLSFNYPIPFPTGRNGFTPSFNLSYTQSAHNGVFGRGWTGSFIKVSRKMTKKLPTYRDEEEMDVFIIAGIGEVIPLLDEQKNKITNIEGDYKVHTYKAVSESQYAKIERWQHLQNYQSYWRVKMADNSTLEFGLSQEAQIHHPQDSSKIYEWLLTQHYDDKGNITYYEYKKENLEHVDLSLSYEYQRKDHLNQKYLKRIFYGNTHPFQDHDNWKQENQWLFEVIFDYGEHAAQAAEAYEETQPWKARHDAFSKYHAGFELRTYRKCERILCFSHFAENGTAPTLNRVVSFHQVLKAGSYELQDITYTGYKKQGSNYSSKSLPPISLRYAENFSEAELLASSIQELQIDNVPHAIDGIKYSWTDLHKDGIPGILVEYPHAWYYKANHGNGKFGELELVGEKPSMIENGQYQLMDWDGNGQLNCVVTAAGQAGFYEQDAQNQQWGTFQHFDNAPKGAANSLNMDLDGEGLPDILQFNNDQSATWYNSKGKKGYANPESIQLPDGVPFTATSSSQELFTMADMSGDGLQDLVRIHNGAVSYWPNMGYGQFGEEIIMEGDLYFDNINEFDASRLMLVDIDGTGTTDILYKGTEQIKIYHNYAGNCLELAYTLDNPGPTLTNYDMLTVMDVLGNGVRSLVWSSFLPGQTEATLRFLPLSPQPPHLLTQVDNNLGRQSQIQYTSSLSYFLEDRRQGNPWHSRLNNHPFVVKQLKDIDLIGGSTMTSQLRYRDGFYDGKERSFTGFAYVEQMDTEQFEVYSDLPSEDYVAPTLSKSWFFNGLLGNDLEYTAQFNQKVKATELKMPKISTIQGQPLNLDWEETHQAYWLLNGQVRRKELHRLDQEDSLVSIEQYSFELRFQQPKQSEEHKASFAMIPSESLQYNCDNVSIDDAQISHQLSIEIDKYGMVTEACEISYSRQAADAFAAQQTTKCIYSQTEVLHHDQDTQHYTLGIPLASKTYEIAGLDTLYDGSSLLNHQQVKAHIQSALQQLIPQGELADYTQTQAGLLAHKKQFYGEPLASHALAHGVISFPLLSHHSESLVFDKNYALQTYQGKATANDLEQLGYKEESGGYWSTSDANEYHDVQHFYLPKSIHHPLRGTTHYAYDRYQLFATQVTNPLGHTLQTNYDYQAFAPYQQIDANENVQETLYDELGTAIVSTQYGTELNDQDTVVDHGHAPLADYELVIPNTIEELLDTPQNYLKNAGTYLYYDLMAWQERQEPLQMLSLFNEAHVAGNSASQAIQISLGYLDGFGRNLQSKLLVEPGKALKVENGQLIEQDSQQRWVVSGRVLYNNKQLPIKQYEPFYSASWQYESEALLDHYGESTQLFYDALGRNIKTVTPLGTFEKVEYSPWKQVAYDTNDTIKDSLFYTINSSLPVGHPVRQMLDDTEKYHDTPTTQHLDNLGRPFLLQETDEQGQSRDTHTVLDIMGNPIEVVDPRGITILRSKFDLSGQAIYQNGADTGERWSLYNILGSNTDNWNARGHHIQQEFDLLQRPTKVWVDQRLVQENSYGNSLSLQEAKEKNALGQLVQINDAAGITYFHRYNYQGKILEQEKAILENYKNKIDWNTNPLLETTTYTSSYQYDALGRITQHHKPDGTIHLPAYHQSGRLKGMEVQGIGTNNQSHQFLKNSTFNARGQVQKLECGNDVNLQYEYDSKLFRLQNFKAIHHPQNGMHRHLQWSTYQYDAVGNIVRLEDHALANLLGNHIEHPLVKKYQYDAFNRLTQATGKIHQAFTQWDGTRHQHSQIPAFKGTQHIHLNNSTAVEDYTRFYQYDESGNLKKMIHQGDSKSWTREMWISSTSNRSISETDSNNNIVTQPESHFDASGNLIKFGHLREVQWNAFNQLQKAVLITRQDQEDDAEYYVYDSSGMRARKVTERLVNGQIQITEKIYLDGCEIIRKRNSQQQVSYQASTSYVEIEGGQRVALIHQVQQGAAANEPTLRLRYQIGNHLGSVAMETDELGQIVSYEEYFPFGGTAFLFGANKKEVELKAYRYSGKERDDATGLYYYGFRYYAPWLCRWLKPDPGGMRDGTNLFLFVNNNPIKKTDLFGLEEKNILLLGLMPSESELLSMNLAPNKVAFLRNRVNMEFPEGTGFFGIADLVEISEDDSLIRNNEVLDFFSNGDGTNSNYYSGVSVQQALEPGALVRTSDYPNLGITGTNKEITDIYFNLENYTGTANVVDPIYPETLDFNATNGHTGTELRSVLAYIDQGDTHLDIHFQHQDGVSTIRAGSNVVEGVPLPNNIAQHLPNIDNSISPPHGGGHSGDGPDRGNEPDGGDGPDGDGPDGHGQNDPNGGDSTHGSEARGQTNPDIDSSRTDLKRIDTPDIDTPKAKMKGGGWIGNLLLGTGVYIVTGDEKTAVQSINPVAETTEAILGDDPSFGNIATGLAEDAYAATPIGMIDSVMWLTVEINNQPIDPEHHNNIMQRIDKGENLNAFCRTCHGDGAALDKQRNPLNYSEDLPSLEESEIFQFYSNQDSESTYLNNGTIQRPSFMSRQSPILIDELYSSGLVNPDSLLAVPITDDIDFYFQFMDMGTSIPNNYHFIPTDLDSDEAIDFGVPISPDFGVPAINSFGVQYYF